MENYQAAMNFEAIVMALGKNDSYCSSLMDEIATRCSMDEAMPFNMAVYSEVLDVPDAWLEEAYLKCRKAFERLDSNVSIIDRSSPLWCPDIKGVRYLYLKGDTSLLLTPSISVVGTRSPSQRGVELAKEVVDSLGESGFTITSGLAMGIDGIAHIQALAKEIRTIGVIGTSVCDVYPKQHERLQSLVAQHGLLVSQFAPSRIVQRYYFMQRNLLMSQISRASLVVEDRDGGGGVQQAQYSIDQGKKVFVLRETMDNRTFLWPRKLKDPVVVSSPKALGNAVRRTLQMERAFAKNIDTPDEALRRTQSSGSTRKRTSCKVSDSAEKTASNRASSRASNRASSRVEPDSSVQPELF